MKLNVRKAKTRFMIGNIDLDGDIFNILVDEHGIKKVLDSNFDTDLAIYSNRFISAIEAGKVPMLELYPTGSHRFHNDLQEYHHVIIGDECFNVYFKDSV